MKIPGIVIAVHLLILAGLAYLHPPQPKPMPRRPVTVQTYVVQEKKPKTVTQSKPKPVVESKPKPTSKPKPVVESNPKPKPVVEAKPKPKQQTSKPKSKPKQVVKEKSDPNRDKLVQMMQQSLASLDSTPSSSEVATTKQIGALASETLTFEASYQEKLIAFLEGMLTLPEKGDVKLSLTVSRSGGVKGVTVKTTSSERNRTYVESTVPTLLLPSFENNFKGENAHTFSITLTSS